MHYIRRAALRVASRKTLLSSASSTPITTPRNYSLVSAFTRTPRAQAPKLPAWLTRGYADGSAAVETRDETQADAQPEAAAADAQLEAEQGVQDGQQPTAPLDMYPERKPPRHQLSASERLNVPKTRTLYVGNLFFEVTQQNVRELFEKFGEIEEAKIIYDPRGLSKGFGYVRFASLDDAVSAVEALNQQVYEGRYLSVQYAVRQGPQEKRSKSQRDPNPPSKTLFIGNMSYEMTDEDLNKLFRSVKNVIDVRVAIDRRTGQPRGFAHADFIDVSSAVEAAEKLNAMEIHGRKLRVDFTMNRSRQEPGSAEEPVQPSTPS